MERRLRLGLVASVVIFGFAVVSLAYALTSPPAGGVVETPAISAQTSLASGEPTALEAGASAPPSTGSFSARLLSAPPAWPASSLKAVGKIIQREDGSISPGDILSFYVQQQDGYRNFRVSLVSMKDLKSGEEIFLSSATRVVGALLL